jgi:hypothetical protein
VLLISSYTIVASEPLEVTTAMPVLLWAATSTSEPT